MIKLLQKSAKKYPGLMFFVVLMFCFVLFGVKAMAETTTISPTTNTSLLQTAGARAYGSAVPIDPATVVNNVINVLLMIIGLLFFGLVFYAGFLWMNAAGNEDQITKSKQIMMAAVIGLIIVLASWVITNFVIFDFALTSLGL